MSHTEKSAPVREVVGIYFDAAALEKTVADLQTQGFTHDEIGMMASQYAVRDRLAHLYEELNRDLDSPDAPNVAFVAKESVGDTVHALKGTLYMVGSAVAGGAVVATAGILGGAVGAAVATTAVFTGIGAVIGRIISQSDAEYLEQQVDEGHLLLFVRVLNEEREGRALKILQRDSAYDPKVYTVGS
ncbi:MAG: hypothetical protein RLZZ385_2321 [Pseudomonadota bacterium]|jgi:hypothetical protein